MRLFRHAPVVVDSPVLRVRRGSFPASTVVPGMASSPHPLVFSPGPRPRLSGSLVPLRTNSSHRQNVSGVGKKGVDLGEGASPAAQPFIPSARAFLLRGDGLGSGIWKHL